jgi:thioredoxin reductase (NADPH)
VAAMDKPVIAVAGDDDDDASLRTLTQELEGRYAAHYRIMSRVSPQEALAELEQLRGEGAEVALVLADQWMPEKPCAEFLARVRELHPAARRGVLLSGDDQPWLRGVMPAAALGQIDLYIIKPASWPDEQFHSDVTESLAEWWRQRGGQHPLVTVIGSESSARVHEIRDLLARNSIPLEFRHADSEEGQRVLRRVGLDQSAGPVVAVYTGVVLANPTNAQLAEALGVSVRPPTTTYDVVVVGAGPAGLAAAVYGASEGLLTLVLEREAVGGQAGTSSLIRNYLGFPHGVSGAALAFRAYRQALTFGTQFVYGQATSLAGAGDLHVVGFADGRTVTARAVVIATGVSYRRLEIAELEPFAGAGVFYGASATEAGALAGKRAFVVGGGNSAGQAALYLARFARQVSILVRSTSLASSMSEYLIREIESAANVDIRYGTEVVGGGGAGRLEQVRLRSGDAREAAAEPADGLFVLIGAEPCTQWLPDAVSRDRWGFILTGPQLAKKWTLQREPLLLETSTPGVFAAGDIRHGSVKRVASAVGDGSIAIRLVHEYLA